MTKQTAVFFFVLLGVLGNALTGQEIPFGEGPEEELDHRQYMEKQILTSSSGQVLRHREHRIGELTRVEGQGFVDSEVAIQFTRDREPLPVSTHFLKALIHNVELIRIWRLRRAGFERAPGQDGLWRVKELVFGYRRKGADGKGGFMPLPEGRSASWRCAKLLAANGQDQTTFRSMAFDMTAKQPLLTVEVEVLGEGYRQRFFGLESAIGVECKEPDGVFRDVRWGGGEQPVAGKTGGVFTLELRIRHQ